MVALIVLIGIYTLAEVIILKLPLMGVPSNVYELHFTWEGFPQSIKLLVLNKPNSQTAAMARFFSGRQSRPAGNSES